MGFYDIKKTDVDSYEYFQKEDDQINEHIEANLSKEKIESIFDTYIIKNKITGIDNIDNDSFHKNIDSHKKHISKTIKNYYCKTTFSEEN
ncbi:MAG: hypothetical protein LBH98_04645 [Chitinispirillales bacterium]|jgi:hypothetical protein|nr:hypothetical protein [Chitinispirillales bacterium]